MRKILLPVILILCFILSSCGHEHVWSEATCDKPKTCQECGATEGESLGHTWVEADCTTPKTCSVCGATEGESLGHTWVEADCTTPKTCYVCGETEGEATGHNVEEWTVIKEPSCSEEGERSGVCTVCKEKVTEAIEKIEHTPGEWKVEIEATEDVPGTRSLLCSVCGEVIKTEDFELTPEEIKENYKAKCKTYSYNEIARDPKKYIATQAKYTGKIVQVMEKGNDRQLRVNVTPKGYGYYDDTIYVIYKATEDDVRFLEDDIVTIYGINMGTISYETVMGNELTIPAVAAKYIELR